MSNLAMNDGNRLTICGCGGIGAIVRAMKANSNAAKLQRYACTALGNLARGKKGENREKIKDEGGIKAIVVAMNHFPNSSGLQRTCLRAFGNLAKDDIGRQGILEADGIRAVVAAMRNFANHGIQEAGCHALGNLSMSEQFAAVTVDLGGAQCVTHAMDILDRNEEVQRCGCFALLYMTRGCLEKLQRQGHVDAITRVVEAAIDTFASSRYIRKYGKKTLEETKKVQCDGLVSLDWPILYLPRHQHEGMDPTTMSLQFPSFQ
uniref:LRRK2 ARM repeat domain-containing protein n=2 Tax=Grammatophora oceanica TaxID=210454 RepID=A0A7S1V065_9STRA